MKLEHTRKKYSRPVVITQGAPTAPVFLACTGRFDCSILFPGCTACGLPNDDQGATCSTQCGEG